MLTIYPDRFFPAIRPLFNNHLSQLQVDGLNTLLNAGKVLPNLESLAYLLATAFHETARTMQPIAEYGKGANFDYGKMLDMGNGPGRRTPYTAPPHFYYGRGYVQLTWRTNYEKMSRYIGVDILGNPELAMMAEHACAIAIYGMTKGTFTGRKLSDYFPNKDGVMNPVGARYIINGQDKAKTIAEYYATFLSALKA
jgi:putative chitinase